MSWYAIDNLDDALDATTELLTPIDWRRWIKLAFVVFFLGSPGGGFNAGNANFPSGGGPDRFEIGEAVHSLQTAIGDIWPLVAGVLLLIVGILVLLQFVGAVMEFVLISSLREERVSIRTDWRAYWKAGVRLFAFRLVVWLIGLLIIGILAAAIVLPMLGIGSPIAPLLGLIALVPLAIVVLLLLALVMGFTTQFVVPLMLLEGRGVLAAWRRFWPTLRAKWKQFAVYAILYAVLSIAGGIVTMIGGLLALLALLIPFGILGLLTYGLYTVSATAGLALGVVVGGLFGLALVVAFSLIRVPVVTYLRYFALLVLGDSNETFDLVPDLRARIRSPEPPEET